MESPQRSYASSPQRELRDGFNEIRHAVEMRETRLAMIMETMQLLQGSRRDEHLSRLAVGDVSALPAFGGLAHGTALLSDSSQPQSLGDMQPQKCEYKVYQKLLTEVKEEQRTLEAQLGKLFAVEPPTNTFPASLGSERVVSPAAAVENDVAASKAMPPIPQQIRFADAMPCASSGDVSSIANKMEEAADETPSLDVLLQRLKQCAADTASRYEGLVEKGEIDHETTVKVHKVFNDVLKELRRAERHGANAHIGVGTATSTTEAQTEMAFWMSVHSRPCRPSIYSVFHKVLLECKVARHWRRATIDSASFRLRKTQQHTSESLQVDSWRGVNVFKLEQEGKLALSTIFMAIWFHKGLSRICKMSDEKVVNLVMDVENSYKDTPYHNRLHAAEAVAASYYIMHNLEMPTPQREDVEDYYRGVDVMILIFAASVHDLRHPGVTNDFLTRTRNVLAIRYNDISVLENFHAASAFELMKSKDYDILEHNNLSPPVSALRQRVISMILATDMKHHKDNHESLSTEVATNSNPADIDKLVLEKNILHVADIAHPLRPYEIHNDFSARVLAEFFAQGDEEKQLGMQPQALFDRTCAPPFPKGQLGFINFVFIPAWKPLAAILGADGKSPLEDCLSANIKNWEQQAAELEVPSPRSEDIPKR